MVAKGATGGPSQARASAARQADDAAPQIISLRSSPGRETARQDLFEIDDVMYSIPLTVPTNSALRYMHVGRKQGQEAQIDYMLGVLLGEDGYEALMNFDDLTEDQLLAVVQACQKVMTGAVEAPKGKRRSS